MNTRLKITELKNGLRRHHTFRPIYAVLLFIMTCTSSCIDDFIKKGSTMTVEGNILDAITHNPVNHAKIEVLTWYESWFNPGVYYSTPTDSGYTDPSGKFSISYNSNEKYKYSLGISKKSYFREEHPAGSLKNKMNWLLFPQGFIKTYINNKISTVKWINVEFIPYFNSQPFFRDGFQNIQLFTHAYSDTTIFTTTLGGVYNILKISVIYTDNTQDEVVVRDTSILTVPHDTVRLSFTLR
jgi:hypothetical protein